MKEINAFIADYKSSGLYKDMYDRWIRGGDLTMPEIEKPKNPTMKLVMGTSGLNEPMNYFPPGGKAFSSGTKG
ncbi:hypothetical protein [Candidatus Formimonas warabiya]|uniref:Uncharacterized protein n=1 Tax=Formimonas warabiya TaxID=1761012 RepID=A0A3G1KZW5_FORW1|nr:hypothetical protein [Candidatus Formimonas warabiya]ATW27929.1 hypothetical protein DCMF_27090 [Candidatus Formimonas warabiya]